MKIGKWMKNENKSQNLSSVIALIKSEIEKEKFLENRELIRICKVISSNIIEIGQKHRIHDLLETAINLHLFEKLNGKNESNAFEILGELEDLSNRMPTQSWRDWEQSQLQQFSTPPALGFVMSQLLKAKSASITLEPSTGTGCLANWLKIAGCQVETNEISARRRELLEIQNYRPHNINAEFINDLLAPGIKPDFILMNPPFSTSGGRIIGRNTDFGFRHVESALERLNPGGRLVCLLGTDSCLKTDKGKVFWNRIGREFRVQAFLKVPAMVYYKHGTTFQTVIIIIEKPHLERFAELQNPCKPQIMEFRSLKEMLQFSETFDLATL